MLDDYNIYEKINLLLYKFEVDINIKLGEDIFFQVLFDKYIKDKIKYNKDNITIKKLNNKINNNKDNSDVGIQKQENEKYYLVRKLYKRLVIKFHPDKGGDENIFIKVKNYYDDNLLIGLLSIYYNSNIKLPELTDDDNEKILEEFIKLYVYLLKNNV